MASNTQQTAPASSTPAIHDIIVKDPLFKNIVGSVQFVVDFSNNLQRSTALIGDLEDYQNDLIGPAPATGGDEDSDTDSVHKILLPSRNQLNLSIAQADAAFTTAEGTAASALLAAVTQWTLAQQQYQFAVLNGQAAVNKAVSPACDQRSDAETRADSISRKQVLFYALQVTCDTALVAYVSAYNGAISALATAAGTLLAAYGAYVSAINTAAAARLLAKANANSKRWQDIEASRDQ